MNERKRAALVTGSGKNIGRATVLNLADFRAKYPAMSVLEIEKRWRAGKTVKLAPGTYVCSMSFTIR
mgnify:CR=1 FL=1